MALAYVTLCVQAQDAVQLRRNQVGCYPDQEKVVVVEGVNPGNKMRIMTPDGRGVKAKSVRRAVSPLSGKTRYVVDLGNLSATGDYRVTLGKESCVLHVSEKPYHDIATGALRLFYLIRSGVAIEQGGVYNRPLGHADTHVLVHNSAASPLRPAGTIISSPLGWYDAGDYNKYVVNSAFSIGLMFAVYEQQRNYFAQLNTNIPESNNATPDFLDEMMFNLKWLMTMQDPYDGGVYHKLTTPNFEGFIMPTDCKQTRYVVQKSVTATLDFAAVMADAARLFEPYQQDYPGFSAQAVAMAERAYQWAKANPMAFYRQRQLKDPAVSTGEYGDRSANDEFFWAAIELYIATGEETYLAKAKELYSDSMELGLGWIEMALYGVHSYLRTETSFKKDAEFTELLKKRVIDEATKSMELAKKDGYYNSMCDNYPWGSNLTVANNGILYNLAYLLSDNKEFRDLCFFQVDYIMGMNVTGYSFLTGFGTNAAEHPHHRPSQAQGHPVPGMVVGGPNGEPADPYAISALDGKAPARCYCDNDTAYSINEVAIYWNSPFIYILAAKAAK